MRHQDLTIIHRLESWQYINAAFRTGATGFVAGDIGRIAYQSDTGEYFRLISTTPTWERIDPERPPIIPPVSSVFGRTGPVAAAANDYSYAQLSGKPTMVNTVFGRSGTVVAAANDYTYAQISGKPVYAALYTGILGTTTTTVAAPGKNMGYGSTVKLTPNATGRVLIFATGNLTHDTTAGATAQLYSGTVAGGVPPGGSGPTGSPIGSQAVHVSVGSSGVPFCCVVLHGGLAVGTQYWFDLVGSASAGTCVISSVCFSLAEIAE